jgi:putative ABC transport system permease protein
MDSFIQDIRYGIRGMLKNRGFTAVAVITLALGIGANTAIFSVLDAVLLKPLPYQSSDQLLEIWEKSPDGGRRSVSPSTLMDWKEQNHVFEQMTAITAGSFNLSGIDDPEILGGANVSASFFEFLGVRPALGRTFLPEEEEVAKDKVIILSHGLWRRRFGADSSLVGRSLTLNGEKYIVVGIMPASFHFGRARQELWTPLALGSKQSGRDARFLTVFAKLKTDLTPQQAQTEMDLIAHRIALQYPGTNQGWGVAMESLRDSIVGNELRQSLLVLFGAVGFLLLIACANVANLTLARYATRQREVAIRATLGAGRLRLTRQLLTESLLLVLFGGAAGMILAYSLVGALVVLIPPFNFPTDLHVGVNHRVLFFTLGISLLAGIIFGGIPAGRRQSLT